MSLSMLRIGKNRGVARVVTRGPKAIRGPANIHLTIFPCLHFSSGTFLGSRGILSFVFTNEINNFSTLKSF